MGVEQFSEAGPNPEGERRGDDAGGGLVAYFERLLEQSGLEFVGQLVEYVDANRLDRGKFVDAYEAWFNQNGNPSKEKTARDWAEENIAYSILRREDPNLQRTWAESGAINPSRWSDVIQQTR
jgi:hypothetical protein